MGEVSWYRKYDTSVPPTAIPGKGVRAGLTQKSNGPPQDPSLPPELKKGTYPEKLTLIKN